MENLFIACLRWSWAFIDQAVGRPFSLLIDTWMGRERLGACGKVAVSSPVAPGVPLVGSGSSVSEV